MGNHLKILTDFHHCSLLRSLVMLFQDRLGAEIYRPIGMEWYTEGFWGINNLEDTAHQYLDFNHLAPTDGTPPLNQVSAPDSGGVYNIYDPGNMTTHKAITFDAFKDVKFDFIIASILEHVPMFEELIRRYQPQAKLIVQVGNNWPPHRLRFHNVLASIAPPADGFAEGTNVLYYRQEFDTNIFCPSDEPNSELRISSYMNVMYEYPDAWNDFVRLEKAFADGWNGYGEVSFRSFGGQCRDGNFSGASALAKSMQADSMILHVKPYGDGFGHIVHNAFACGKPLIFRRKYVAGTLVEGLLNEFNSVDLDELGEQEQVDCIAAILDDKYALKSMSEQAYKSFRKNVDFADDARRVGEWLQTL